MTDHYRFADTGAFADRQRNATDAEFVTDRPFDHPWWRVWRDHFPPATSAAALQRLEYRGERDGLYHYRDALTRETGFTLPTERTWQIHTLESQINGLRHDRQRHVALMVALVTLLPALLVTLAGLLVSQPTTVAVLLVPLTAWVVAKNGWPLEHELPTHRRWLSDAERAEIERRRIEAAAAATAFLAYEWYRHEQTKQATRIADAIYEREHRGH